MQAKPTIAIIGGTGNLGSGLAKRWVAAGYPVVIGSRSREKALTFAESLAAGGPGTVRGEDNVGAALAGDVAVVAVPFASHRSTLAEIGDAVRDKIVVDTVVPLVPPKVSVVQLPAEGSAAQIARRILPKETRVVSAFHNVGAGKLHTAASIECDVLVFGDDKEARQLVIGLVQAIGALGIDGGVLANSAAAEALTSILIGINRRYKVDGAGIHITGLRPPAAR